MAARRRLVDGPDSIGLTRRPVVCVLYEPVASDRLS